MRAKVNYFAGEKHEKPLEFSYSGSINGQRVHIRMDSGAGNDFVSEKFVRACGMKAKRTSQPVRLSMADGTGSFADHVANVKLVSNQENAPRFADKVQMCMANLDNDYEVLSGQPWLKKHGASLCFATDAV